MHKWCASDLYERTETGLEQEGLQKSGHSLLSHGQKEELNFWGTLVQLLFMAKISYYIAAFCKNRKQIACHKQMRKLTKAMMFAEKKMSLFQCLSCSVNIRTNAESEWLVYNPLSH